MGIHGEISGVCRRVVKRTTMTPKIQIAESAGLCASCRHCRPIESGKGSVFVLCELSKTDPRFPKYPRLPVLSCDGRSEEHTSELQSHSFISYAVFCLKKKNDRDNVHTHC